MNSISKNISALSSLVTYTTSNQPDQNCNAVKHHKHTAEYAEKPYCFAFHMPVLDVAQVINIPFNVKYARNRKKASNGHEKQKVQKS